MGIVEKFKATKWDVAKSKSVAAFYLDSDSGIPIDLAKGNPKAGKAIYITITEGHVSSRLLNYQTSTAPIETDSQIKRYKRTNGSVAPIVLIFQGSGNLMVYAEEDVKFNDGANGYSAEYAYDGIHVCYTYSAKADSDHLLVNEYVANFINSINQIGEQ